MITVVYRVVVKENKIAEFESIIAKFSACAHESIDCIYYTFFKSVNNPLEYLVYYKFTSKKSQDEHILNLHNKIGPPRVGRDLPEKFLSLLEKEDLVLFDDK